MSVSKIIFVTRKLFYIYQRLKNSYISIKMPSALQKCRICLSVNVKMFTLKNTNIENLYQSLTQVYVDIDDATPAMVCYLCYARLQQCYRLQQKAIKSNALLEQLLTGRIMQATANAIINHQYTSNLQMSTIYHLDLEPTTYKDVLIEPKVESWHDCPVSVKEETEAMDEERKNVHLIMDFSEDGYDPYGYIPEAIHSDSKEDKQITAIGSKHCDGIKDDGHDLEQRKQQGEDTNDPDNCASEAIHSDSEDDQPLISLCSKKCVEIQDTHGLERNKDQEKVYQYKIEPENEIRDDPLSFGLNRRVNLIEIQVGTDSKNRLENLKTVEIVPKQVTFQSSTFNAHLNMHTVTKVFSCNICEYCCTHAWKLKRHMKIHTGDKPFSCNICEYKCAVKNKLKNHMRTHTGEKPFSCNNCKYRCARKDALKVHMRTHIGEKHFSCNICKYRSPCKNVLKIHMKTHPEEKPYSCNICEYKCVVKNKLKDHIRTHTGEKPFSCNICKYRFVQKSHLKRHMRTHTGEKPFSCNICEYKCAFENNLKRHTRTHRR